MIQSMDRLKVFYHVFSEKSVMAASKKLHVSQSAVSQSLQKLEAEINNPLFTRLHKRLVPTFAGEQLFLVVKPFMQELETCLKKFEYSKDRPFGLLRIGAPVEFGKKHLPGIAAGFREAYPDVTFYLKFGDPGTLLPLVEAGKLDFALVDVFLTQNLFAGNLDMYHFNPVVDEEVILASSSQYHKAFVKQDHSFKNLIQQRFIAYQEDAQTIKNWFKHHFGKYNIHPDVVLTVHSQQAVISGIKHHTGMGIIASHMVKKEIQAGRILPITTRKSAIINQISLVILKEKIPTLAEKVFQTFLLEKIRSLRI